ncbi:hypothetical protein NL676_028745 [Syzygium grande]|nr:hypothetical protein NL676_028745 [Syzygium grande]
MMMKKSFGRKWLVIAVAAYLLIIMELLPSPTIASSLPAQQLPEAATGGSEEGKTGSPRKALGGGFKLKGAINLVSYAGFGKKKWRKALESRSLRASPTVSLPSPHPSDSHSQFVPLPTPRRTPPPPRGQGSVGP